MVISDAAARNWPLHFVFTIRHEKESKSALSKFVGVVRLIEQNVDVCFCGFADCGLNCHCLCFCALRLVVCLLTGTNILTRNPLAQVYFKKDSKKNAQPVLRVAQVVENQSLVNLFAQQTNKNKCSIAHPVSLKVAVNHPAGADKIGRFAGLNVAGQLNPAE